MRCHNKTVHWLLFGIIAFSLCYVSHPGGFLVGAQSAEDALEDDATVETDADDKQKQAATEGGQQEGDASGALSEQDTGTGEEFPDGLPKPSPLIEARLLFTEPSGLGVVPRQSAIVPLDIPVGRVARVLIAFKHVADGAASAVPGAQAKEFTLDAVAGALRYPSDYSYYIQNFTAMRLDRVVEPNREATIFYGFMPAAQLQGRPYGMTVRVFYHDAEGTTFVQTVMNETVQLVEWEGGPGAHRWLDTEALFMYVVVAGLALLFALALYHLWQSYAPKKLRAAKKGAALHSQTSFKSQSSAGSGAGSDKEENGAAYQAAVAGARAKGVDVDWIPKEHLMRETSRRSPPRQSPKQRKVRRDVSSQDESE